MHWKKEEEKMCNILNIEKRIEIDKMLKFAEKCIIFENVDTSTRFTINCIDNNHIKEKHRNFSLAFFSKQKKEKL